MKSLWFTALIAGCTSSSSPDARLADLPAPRIVGMASGFTIEYDSSVACVTLASQVSGTVDGHPLTISPGGWRSTTEGNVCDGIGFTFPTPLDNNPVTAIELADGETTWSLGVEGLAPRSWTVSAPATVTEGSDVVVTYSPMPAGVAINDVYIAPSGARISPFAAAPTDGHTVHIDAGYWSDLDEADHGSTMAGTIAIELGPLPLEQCAGPTSCSFDTDTPDPAQAVTIVVP